MGFGFAFPGSQLKAAEKTQEAATLASMDEKAVFTVNAVRNYGSQRISEEDFIAFRDGMAAAVAGGMEGGITVRESGRKENPLQYYFKAVHSSGESGKRYMFVAFGGWVSKRDNQNYLYTVTMECPEAEAAEYQRLMDRMYAASVDM